MSQRAASSLPTDLVWPFQLHAIEMSRAQADAAKIQQWQAAFIVLGHCCFNRLSGRHCWCLLTTLDLQMKSSSTVLDDSQCPRIPSSKGQQEGHVTLLTSPGVVDDVVIV